MSVGVRASAMVETSALRLTLLRASAVPGQSRSRISPRAILAVYGKAATARVMFISRTSTRPSSTGCVQGQSSAQK